MLLPLLDVSEAINGHENKAKDGNLISNFRLNFGFFLLASISIKKKKKETRLDNKSIFSLANH